jgi:endo-1,3-1,4-beta-glycanase ExoK
MGGALGSAGTVGAAGSSGGGAGPQFKLLWRDEFDAFDANRWQKANHDFPENAAQFTPDNAVVEGGFLKLRITNVPNNGHAYSAAEVYTNDQFTFGRFEARIRFAPGSGIVSSLFTYRDDSNHGWNEIDIENLGYITDGVQYNLISSPLGGGALTYQPKVVKTGFSPTQDFHDYAIEWTPVDIRFYVDGALTWRDVQTRIDQASRLRMNIWPTNNAKTTFAGPLDASKIPAEAQYDWVAVYAYQP